MSPQSSLSQACLSSARLSSPAARSLVASRTGRISLGRTTPCMRGRLWSLWIKSKPRLLRKRILSCFSQIHWSSGYCRQSFRHSVINYYILMGRRLQGDFWTELPKISQDILAVPAASVPSERLFCISGILSENKGCNISPGNVERRVLLKANQNNF